MRRLSISLHIEFGKDDPPEPQRDTTFDAMVERSHPDDVSQRAELDSRTIGLAHQPQEGR